MPRKPAARRSPPARPVPTAVSEAAPQAPPPATVTTGKSSTACFNKLLRLEVSGGFLDGLAIELSPHLNCIIGARGTGKSSVFELIRFALQGPRALTKVVANGLGTGQVRLLVETRTGQRCWIERTLHSGPELTDDAGKEIQLARAFEVDAFSQHQLETVAGDPAEQLRMLDRFAAEEVEQLGRRLRELEAALRTNAELTDQVEADVRQLAEETARLPELERRLSGFPEIGGEHAALFERELSGKGLRDRELLELSRLEGGISRQREALLAARGLLAGALGPVPEEPLQGPNGALLAEARSAALAASEELERAHEAALAIVERVRVELDAKRRALEARHAEQDVRYREVLALQAREKGTAHERVALQRQIYELQERDRTREERGRALETLRQARRQLLGQLSEVRDQRTAVRVRVAAWLSERLAPSIRVSIKPGAHRDSYRALLDQALKEVGKNTGSLAGNAAAILPADLVRRIRARERTELADDLDVRPERADLLFQALLEKPALWEVETVDIEDRPVIELQQGGEWKEASTLSLGQRCTAFLPIVLLESGDPLLIDEPESNLDGETLVSQVVSRVLEVKPRRQIVFVTHNPNLVIVGQAERVFRMSSDGKTAQVEAVGSWQALKERVERLLEGGREAFQERSRAYGH